MSVSIETVEFERPSAQGALLTELEGEPPYTIHGVALGAGDVTVGKSGIKKKWPAEELRRAADTLEGKKLVEDHSKKSRDVVGEVTKAGYKEGVGVIYEAELFDEDLADKINDSLLEVSIRGGHIDVDEMELDEETGAKIVENITFADLSIVQSGAAPSNSVDIGEHEELSIAELSAFTESLKEEEIEAGSYVKWDDNQGIVLTMPEDGEVEVDIYEESDGEYRPIGETEMVSVDDLSMWDVDEEDIGPMEDDEDDSEDEEEASEHGMDSDEDDTVDVPTEHRFESEEEARNKAEEMGIEGAHTMMFDDEEYYVPGTSHNEYMDAISEQSGHKEDEMAESVDPPEFEEGMMVQWSVNPDMFGEIVHNPDDKDIIMVEVMEMMDGEMKPTGHTLTAAPPDLEAMDEEKMSSVDELESFSDYPEAASENAQMALDAREETDNPNDCGTDVGWKRANQLADGEPVSEDVVARMASFNRHRQNSDMDDDEGKADCGWMMWKAWGGDEGVDWAMEKQDEVEEMADRIEGEEEEITSDADEEVNKERSPERYPEGGDTEEASVDEGDASEEGDTESDTEEELQDYSFHNPDWSGTTESEWSSPDMEDFDTDDLSDIDDHFLISASGFPPENYGDLKLPVVEPNGDLNVNALSAVKGGRGVSAVDGLTDDMEESIIEWVNETASEEFDKDWQEEASNQMMKRRRTIDDTGDEPNVGQDGGPVGISLQLIQKYLRLEGKHERDTVDDMLSWLFGNNDLPTETVGDFRTATNVFLNQTPGTDSYEGMTVEQFRDWLLLQGRDEPDQRGQRPDGGPPSHNPVPVHVLTGDDLRQRRKSEESELDSLYNKVDTIMTEDNIEEQLADLDEPVAVEKSDLEDLEDKADRFDEMSDSLSDLKERTEILDEVDSDKVDELAESDEPVVIESARYESLTAEAEQVKNVYASSLAEEVEVFDSEELTDKFSIEELREKFEEHIGDPEEELASSEDAEPRSGDPEEEELEEQAESGDTEEASDEEEQVEEMQAELQDKILGGD